MHISPDTLQPVPPGTVPNLGAAAGSLVIAGVAAVQLQLFQPGATDPIAVVIDWTPNPASGTYSAPLTPEQMAAILSAGPTLHCQVNGGPTFHVRNKGAGNISSPSNPGSGPGTPGPGANYYTREQTDQLLSDIIHPAGGGYSLEGPNGERRLYVKRHDKALIPIVGGGEGNIGSIGADTPIPQEQEEDPA
jgi:hypothetical protein